MYKSNLYYKKIRVLLFLIFSLNIYTFAQTSKEPHRKTRAESFFGLHFDFHAEDKDKDIGKTLTAEMIDSMLILVKPDFIQIDCKGHPGVSSYPTKVGNSGNSFVKDPLQIFRDATAKRGVALYVHFSGVRDYKVVEQHPEWARIDENGKPDKESTSLFSAYEEQSLIPQLKEISKYNVDGAWVDGDCWAANRDYSVKALKAFQDKTGITTIPKKINDTYYYEFSEFSRDAYKKYLARYVNELHNFNPKFQIASNWAYSSMMPEKVEIPVDFISGDLTPQNSVNSAAFEARCLALQGKPWDLMSWGFTYNWKTPGIVATKTAIQLKQEAAEVLAMGGGFQAYFQQNRDASLQPWTFNLMKELAFFCRERQAFCHTAEPVSQIALFYSTESFKRTITDGIYRNGSDLHAIQGIMTALLDGQQAVEILMDHHLKGNMKKYPLIVIPEWKFINEELKKEFLEYVNDGGNLLVIGAEAVKPFGKELGITFISEPAAKIQFLGYDNYLTGLNSLNQSFTLNQGTKSFGTLYDVQDFRYPKGNAGSIKGYGKGKIAGIYFNMGENYKTTRTSISRKYINGMVSELFKDPIVEVKGSEFVHVGLSKLNKKLMVNLINTAGQHNDNSVYVFDEIPSIGPLKVAIKSNAKPLKVTLQPEGKELNYKYENGKVLLNIPKLDLHSIIVLD